VVLVRARDIDRIDLRVGAQPGRVRMRAAAGLALEACPRLGPRVGRGCEHEARIAKQRRPHQGICAAKPDDAESHRPRGRSGLRYRRQART
jgi:hypothetical protein